MNLDEPLVPEWLQDFAATVRARRVDRGREMFHGDCTGFGTVAFRADDVGDLEARQWGRVWPGTRDFDFDYGSVLIQTDRFQAVAIAVWKSHRIASAAGSPPREGRATIVLRLHAGKLLATHTHFSLRPAPEP